MSFGSQSSDQQSSSQLPSWYVPYAKKALERGNQIANLGYVPYQGADVAAFNQSQINGMQDANNWSAAFNTPGQAAPSVAASLPQAQDFGNGLKGYSSYNGYMDQLEGLKKSYPGLWRMITAQAINPVTGRPGNFPPGAPGGGGNNALIGQAAADRLVAQPNAGKTREEQLFGTGNNGGDGGTGSSQSDFGSNMINWIKQYWQPKGSSSVSDPVMAFMMNGGQRPSIGDMSSQFGRSNFGGK